MRNYIDPKMKITIWENENIAMTASNMNKANEFLNSSQDGASQEGTIFESESVAPGNILNFAD